MNQAGKYKILLRFASQRALNALFPPICPLCAQAVETQGDLCASCGLGLDLHFDPRCEFCGTPLEGAARPWICAQCYKHPRPWKRGYSAVHYEESARALVLGFKHGGRKELAPLLARLMCEYGIENQAQDTTLITAMPIHWRRHLHRGYNQAVLLAFEIAHILGQKYAPHLIKRKIATPPQDKHAGFTWRYENVKNAFACPKTGPIAGQNILLVDDVMTSGASLEAATLALLEAGAQSVSIAVFARAGYDT